MTRRILPRAAVAAAVALTLTACGSSTPLGHQPPPTKAPRSAAVQVVKQLKADLGLMDGATTKAKGRRFIRALDTQHWPSWLVQPVHTLASDMGREMRDDTTIHSKTAHGEQRQSATVDDEKAVISLVKTMTGIGNTLKARLGCKQGRHARLCQELGALTPGTVTGTTSTSTSTSTTTTTVPHPSATTEAIFRTVKAGLNKAIPGGCWTTDNAAPEAGAYAAVVFYLHSVPTDQNGTPDPNGTSCSGEKHSYGQADISLYSTQKTAIDTVSAFIAGGGASNSDVAIYLYHSVEVELPKFDDAMNVKTFADVPTDVIGPRLYSQPTTGLNCNDMGC